MKPALREDEFGTTAFREALQRGELRSERLRAGALIAVVLFLECILLYLEFAPLQMGPALTLPPLQAFLALSAVLLGLVVYEAVVWWRIGQLAQKGEPMSVAFRYGNVMVEAAAPALMLWTWSGTVPPDVVLGGAMPMIYFLFIAASALHLDSRLSVFSGVVSATFFGLMAAWIGSHAPPDTDPSHIVSALSYTMKGTMMVVAGVVSGFVASQLRANLRLALETARERDRAVSVFGQHVSPQVAERLIHQPVGTTGEVREVCVMFLDIRGFSQIAAQRTPAEVMGYLNTLFPPLIGVVNEHGGIVNKFLGDGFMAVFGSPLDDPDLHRNAVRCARELIDSVNRLNSAGVIPQTRIGIGIHAGDVVAGTVGSSDRMEYTVLGETVNIAARIEQETKPRQAQLLVSRAVLEGQVELETGAEDLGMVDLRGVSGPVHLYRLL